MKKIINNKGDIDCGERKKNKPIVRKIQLQLLLRFNLSALFVIYWTS